MKSLLTVSAAAFMALMISCNGGETSGLSATAQKNLDAMNGVGKCFETKDFSKLGDYIAENAVDHAGENGDVVGLENLKAEFEKWAQSVENNTGTVITEMANDEYVAQWMHFTGTVVKDNGTMKAGDTYDMTAIELAKCKDGKLIEHWTFLTPQEMMKMMPAGEMPMPPADASAQ